MSRFRHPLKDFKSQPYARFGKIGRRQAWDLSERYRLGRGPDPRGKLVSEKNKMARKARRIRRERNSPKFV